MLVRFLFISLLLVTACARAPQFEAASLPAGEWQLDPDHASLVFRIDHAKGLSHFTARFDRFDASLQFDPALPEKSQLSVQIEAASINTGVAALDKKLRNNASALHAEAYPQISFTSQQINPTAARTGDVAGTLTLRGETRPIMLHVTWNGTSFDPLRRKQVIGFSAHGNFKRSDFGANAWSRFGVGDQIDVQIEVEFLQSNPA
jgi:polyisoprenoid-binding protein YceI